jgi:hypothetical protein
VNAPAAVSELIGIYDADGGLRGELRYLLGRWRGMAHCSLCDVTHGRVREREAFRSLRALLPVPFTLLHRNELSAEFQAATGNDTPCVLVRTDGELSKILDASAIEACGGDVDAFNNSLHEALAERHLNFADGQ